LSHSSSLAIWFLNVKNIFITEIVICGNFKDVFIWQSVLKLMYCISDAK
jgi:hypothetical protein